MSKGVNSTKRVKTIRWITGLMKEPKATIDRFANALYHKDENGKKTNKTCFAWAISAYGEGVMNAEIFYDKLDRLRDLFKNTNIEDAVLLQNLKDTRDRNIRDLIESQRYVHSSTSSLSNVRNTSEWYAMQRITEVLNDILVAYGFIPNQPEFFGWTVNDLKL